MNALHKQNAIDFHALHNASAPLKLANAWDVASALVIERAGAKAIATTSAGVAWSQGFPDGDKMDRARALAVVRDIAGAVRVPVSADIEGGYAASAAEIEETIVAALELGVVGVNIEDGPRTTNQFAVRIEAVRRAADRYGVPLFINARVDVFWAQIGVPEQRLAETLMRAQRYIDAGADGIFVPAVNDIETIAALTNAIAAPVNVLVGPGSPSVSELGELGVARISLGSKVALAAYDTARQVAAELFGTGTCQAAVQGLGYGELNKLLSD